MFRRALSKPRDAVRRFATYDTPHSNYVQAQVTTLSNGVRVVTQPTDSVGANVSLYLDAGGRSSLVQGQAYLAHTLSLGDKKFHKEIENIGGAIHADIGVDASVYNTTVFNPAEAGRAIELLSKAVTNPEINAETLKTAKDQCLFELDNDPRSTKEILQERLRMACWRDGDLGYNLHGTHEGVAQTSEASMKQQFEINQTGRRLVVSATGNVNHADIVKAAEKQLGGLAAHRPFIVNEKPYFLGSELVYRDDEMGPTAYFACGYKGVNSTHAYSPAFELIRQLLGDYNENEWLVPHRVSGNRVKEAVSRKMLVGCAEKFSYFNHHYKDTGMIGWYFECDEIAFMSCVDEMMFGMNLMSFSTTEEEVDRAKREMVIARGHLLGTDTELAKHNARSLMHQGRVISWAEWYHRIMSLSAGEVNHVAYERIHDEEIVVTGLGPLHGYESLYTIRKQNGLYRYGF